MITELNQIALAIWGLLCLLVIAGMASAVASERRKFAAVGRESAWLRLRVATLPIMLLVAAMLWMPLRGLSHSETLLTSHLVLLAAAPFAYFLLHIILGVSLRPRLSIREALRISITGLLMVLVPAFAMQLLNPWVLRLAGAAKEGQMDMADERPSPFEVIDQQRFLLPRFGEVWTERWRAPEGLLVDRVEREVDGSFVRVDGISGATLCRDGRDFRVFWPAGMPAPHWQAFWKAPEGLVRSEWMSSPPRQAAKPFEVRWLADGGAALPLPLPRNLVTVAMLRPDGRESFEPFPQSASGAVDSCLSSKFEAAGTTPITAVALSLWRRDTQELLRSELRREMPVPAASGAFPTNP